MDFKVLTSLNTQGFGFFVSRVRLKCVISRHMLPKGTSTVHFLGKFTADKNAIPVNRRLIRVSGVILPALRSQLLESFPNCHSRLDELAIRAKQSHCITSSSHEFAPESVFKLTWSNFHEKFDGLITGPFSDTSCWRKIEPALRRDIMCS